MFGVVLNASEVIVYPEQHDQDFGVNSGRNRPEDEDQNSAQSPARRGS